MNSAELTYRRTAAVGASGFGLLIALFDTLAGDLRRAAQAQRISDIGRRSRDVEHALLVIGHLENWVNRGPGGELATMLLSFYARLRRRLIEAQVKQSVEMFEQQMADVLTIREYWQKSDISAGTSMAEVMEPPAPHFQGYSAMQGEIRQTSWSA